MEKRELKLYKARTVKLGATQVEGHKKLVFAGAIRAAKTKEDIDKIVVEYSINRTLFLQ